MAERRMFAKSIVTSDTFLDMGFSTRCLYFALGMYADDDGFVDSPKSIMRQTGATQLDLDELCKNGFVIPCESGVIVITHWNVNNNIRKNRKKPTLHTDELKKLNVQNGVYILKNGACQPNDNQTATNCQPNDCQMAATCQPNGCIGKYRQDKDSIGKDSIGKASAPAHAHTHTRESGSKFVKPTIDEIATYIAENGYNMDAERFYYYYEANGWRVGRSPMKN